MSNNTTTDQTAVLAQVNQLRARADELDREARRLKGEAKALIDAEATRMATYHRGDVVDVQSGKRTERHVIVGVIGEMTWRDDIRINRYDTIRIKKDGMPGAADNIRSWHFVGIKPTGEAHFDLLGESTPEAAQ